MRLSGDPSWFEHRHTVPLTGREPVLGRLMNRLQKRGPGWGWLTLRGPAGSGVSRLLREASRLVSRDGAPAPLCIHPVREARDPLEPLRRAIRPLFRGDGVLALQRAVRALLPADPHEVRALAQWLAGDGPVRRTYHLDPLLVSRLLGRVCTSGPLLVDEVGDLDPATIEVLRAGLQAGGPDVIAGTTSDHWVSESGATWQLEPLGGSQIELLLRRWLRHSPTARRLAERLAECCQGWPGRIVGAVRDLGREGCLVKERRGIVFARAPARWPDGLRRADVFHEHVRDGDERRRGVFDLAAVYGGQVSPAVLAQAAGTSEAFIHGLTAEATAARGGRAPGYLFAHRAARERHLEAMPAPRLHEAIQRLQAQPESAQEERPDQVLLRLRVLIHAGEHEEAATRLHDLLAPRTTNCGLEAWACDLLADIAFALAAVPTRPAREALAHAAHVLWDVGRHAQAEQLCHCVGHEPDLSTPALVLAHVRMRSTQDVRGVLEAAVPILQGARGIRAFDAWALLAEARFEAREVHQARDAWLQAVRALAGPETTRWAVWHEGLAQCARERGCISLAAAHLRRAIRLRRAAGEVTTLPHTLHALGEMEILRDRVPASLAPLMRAARLHAMLGAPSEAATVRQRVGRVLLGLHAYDRAIEELRSALRMTDPERDASLLPHLHLALADAYRGCGETDNERHHGREASKTADTTLLRLRAAAVIARADLTAGLPGAEPALTRLESDLREADCVQDADRARTVLFNAHLVSNDPQGAESLLPLGAARAMRAYAAARLDLTEGRHDAASTAFRALGGNHSLPVDLRAACYAHLADALHLSGRQPAAREAAVAAAALLEVRRRSRADDTGLHRVLARVFSGVGEAGRAEGHRSAARRSGAPPIESGEGKRAG